MSEIIAEMVERLCPEGVEYVRLGDVAEVSRGKRFVKADMVDSGVPCIHYGEIYTYYGISATQTKSFVTEERAEGLRYANPGDVVMATAGETEEDLGMSVAWLGSEPAVIHDACYRVVSDYDAKFLSYYFSTPQFRQEFRRHISTGKISSISVKAIENSRIPVLPFEVQNEIVKVLDEYSAAQQELEEQLQAEIEARRAFVDAFENAEIAEASDSFRHFPIGEMGTVITGRTPKSADKVAWGEDYGFVTPADITERGFSVRATERNLSKSGWDAMQKIQLPAGAICMVCIGTVGKLGVLEHAAVSNQQINSLILNHEHDVKFIYSALRSQRSLIENFSGAGQGTMPILNKTKFSSLKVPVPPLEVQKRIGEEIQALSNATEELVQELEAEITARHTQFETFRDQLLTFPRKEVAA